MYTANVTASGHAPRPLPPGGKPGLQIPIQLPRETTIVTVWNVQARIKINMSPPFDIYECKYPLEQEMQASKHKDNYYTSKSHMLNCPPSRHIESADPRHVRFSSDLHPPPPPLITDLNSKRTLGGGINNSTQHQMKHVHSTAMTSTGTAGQPAKDLDIVLLELSGLHSYRGDFLWVMFAGREHVGPQVGVGAKGPCLSPVPSDTGG